VTGRYLTSSHISPNTVLTKYLLAVNTISVLLSLLCVFNEAACVPTQNGCCVVFLHKMAAGGTVSEKMIASQETAAVPLNSKVHHPDHNSPSCKNAVVGVGYCCAVGSSGVRASTLPSQFRHGGAVGV
jgi:hypothetical protein